MGTPHRGLRRPVGAEALGVRDVHLQWQVDLIVLTLDAHVVDVAGSMICGVIMNTRTSDTDLCGTDTRA